MDAALDAQIDMRRRFAASVDEVWRAWTQPSRFARWMAPGPTWGCHVPVLELRAGGRYRIEMTQPDGTQQIVEGTYERVDPPSRLDFTWKWAKDPGPGSVVRVDIEADGGGSRLRLRHARIASKQGVKSHADGWNGCLAQLASHLSDWATRNQEETR